ncbi:uncharacterized protein PITG_20740 [Phytophthora infestans T30-4]|uniref:PiggyBac transposable element-derived protein domain-containing protein n=1 Tax=Phytophthora infestans (strain T30-4) TaxID=403677 RepID=D0P2A4_PHYIT|nr:uncharacterized protein PITG_20740 [Phytophthora infestans T30-4]EEY55855.1 conserved hypothetical protein [Phytophthora infestans T30-4]|eukprot:XP_002895564.1 conserved hypothetical protein [Phytophthora infestans T30-4]
MSAWKGHEAKFTHDGLPHKTKTAQKSEGKEPELKSLADGDSGVLLSLELVEGSARQRQKQYFSEFGEGTAVVLRLVEQYKGACRTIVGDSAFASVKTLVQLKKRLGLYVMGIVKTASVEYPKAHLKKWVETDPLRGSFKVMMSFTESGKQYMPCAGQTVNTKC